MELPDFIALKKLTASPDLIRLGEAALSPAERERVASFGSLERQRSFLLGRLAAKSLLAEHIGVSASEIELDVRNDGSISVLRAPYHLSISHSGMLAAAAISRGPVGLDLERVRPRPASLFRFMLHPDEMSLVDRIDLSGDHKLVLFWALKEAVLKANRTGLRISPKTLRLDIDLPTGQARVTGQGNWLVYFEVHEDHVIAVASRE